MSVVQISVVADVPEDQTTAAQAAAAAFVANLPDQADGALIIAATFGGESLIPTAQEAFDAALAELKRVTSKTPRATADDVAAAVSALDDAARALELSMLPAAPAAAAPAAPAADVPADPAVVAATAPAPIGEDPAPAPAEVPAEVPAGTPIG